jgi:hypothetical protein
MNAAPEREIVIEYERVQRIKKRSSTQLFHCNECGAISDFVSLTRASSLFDVETERLNDFITANRCHLKNNICGKVFVCLASLLSRMKIQADIRRLER